MKKFALTSILLLVLCSLLVSLPEINRVYTTESTGSEKALAFLGDVVQLDMAKYNATLIKSSISYPSELGGLAFEELHYILESKESKIDVGIAFRNNTLSWCGLFVQGSLLSTQPATNVLDEAKGFLQRYQTYAWAHGLKGLRDFEAMISTLQAVDTTGNMTITLGNVKLEVSNKTDYTGFRWTHLLDGLSLPGITLDFRQGTFFTFSDVYNIYKVGSTSVNFSKEEAINIALKHVENFSWTVGGVEVTDFNILEEPLTAELLITRTREPLTLYPYWRIELYLDKIYPGYVNRISLAIWADTGEVASCLQLTHGGSPPPEVPTTDQTPPTISIQSLENKTYIVNNVSLTFAVNEPTSWLAYSLDGQANLTITGNTTLSGLSEGSHSLVVYAEDLGENIGASETIIFSIAQETESTEPFPTWIIAVIASIVVVVVALLVYFTKFKKTTGKVEK